MATLSQLIEQKENIQVLIRPNAALRLRVAAAIRRRSLGEVISDLLEAHLPEPPTEKVTGKRQL